MSFRFELNNMERWLGVRFSKVSTFSLIVSPGCGSRFYLEVMLALVGSGDSIECRPPSNRQTYNVASEY